MICKYLAWTYNLPTRSALGIPRGANLYTWKASKMKRGEVNFSAHVTWASKLKSMRSISVFAERYSGVNHGDKCGYTPGPIYFKHRRPTIPEVENRVFQAHALLPASSASLWLQIRKSKGAHLPIVHIVGTGLCTDIWLKRKSRSCPPVLPRMRMHLPSRKSLRKHGWASLNHASPPVCAAVLGQASKTCRNVSGKSLETSF